MEETGIEHGGQGAPSRREIIRRGAIALGLGAWGVPLVQAVRNRGHGGSQKVDTGPEEIGVQVVTAACTTCVDVGCGGFTICGSEGVFDCICAPSADAYPIAACVCGLAGFCEDLTPCSAGCPPGYGCIQGCCPEPVCLPPCPDGVASLNVQSQVEGLPEGDPPKKRLTVSGTYV